MFFNKNKNISLNAATQMEVNLKNIPVHTMQHDLETGGQLEPSEVAAAEPQMTAPAAESQMTAPDHNTPLTPLQQSSPFLQANFGANRSIPNVPTEIPLPETPAETEEKPSKLSAIGGYLPVILVVVLFIAAGAAAYYYWSIRQSGEDNQPAGATPAAPSQPAQLPSLPPAPTPPSTTPAISADAPNYININVTNATSTEVKNILQANMDKVSQSGISLPVEFIITDPQNNPIAFSTFANIFGLKLSPAVTINLADSFSLFVYNDTGNMRLGLSVSATNSTPLIAAMAHEEPALISEVSPLFMGAPFTNPTNTFGKGNYQSTVVHFANVVSGQPLSIDYTIFNQKLLIGTSKMTLRSMIDRSPIAPPATISAPPAP